MRILHNFFAFKTKKEEVKKDNGDGSFLVTEEEVKTPVEVFLKKLSSRDIDDMRLFESVTFSGLQNKGVATKLMIINSYSNAGGVLSDAEIKEWQQDLKEANKLRNEILKKKAEKSNTEELEREYTEIITELQNREIVHESIFQRSAETLTEQEIVLWLTLNFTFLKNEDKFIPVFKGNNYEEKKDFYYEICDDDSETFSLEKDVFTKSYGLWHLWIRGVDSPEQFKEYQDLVFPNERGDSGESVS